MTDGVIVVTGGSRGIGAAIARRCARSGATIVVNYVRDQAAAESVVGEIEGAGGTALAVQADVTAPDEVERLFAAADQAGPLRGLVSNVGVALMRGRVDATDRETFALSLRLNLAAGIYCGMAGLKRMSRRHGGQGGAMVFVSSASSRHGNPGQDVVYATAKGGLETFVVGFAKEVAADGVRVNAIRPGLTLTDPILEIWDEETRRKIARRIPIGRGAAPEEMAEPVSWLLTEEASFVTGTVLSVTGGGWAHPSP